MKVIRALMCLVACTAICCGLLYAQDADKKKDAKPAAKAAKEKPKAPAGMPAVKPAPELVKFTKAVAGNWTTAEKHEASPFMPAGGSTGMGVLRPGPGGMSLVLDYKSKGDMGPFAGHGVTWWNASQKAFTGLWCDSMGPACVVGGSGKWDGDSVVFNQTMDDGGGHKMSMRSTYTDITPNSFTYKMAVGPEGGELKPWMTIKYTRAGAAKAGDTGKKEDKKQ